MENVKLVIADIDGTLTSLQKPLGPVNVAAMKECHKRGIKLGLASGRRVDAKMKAYAFKWGLDFPFDVLIGMNGGELYIEETGQLYDYYKLSKETLKEIIDMMAPLDLNPFVYKGNGMLVRRMDAGTIASLERNGNECKVADDISELYEDDNHKILFRVEEDKMPEVFAYAKAHPSPKYQSFLTQTTMLEFQDPRVNKGMALEKYCEITGMPIESVWAFGDMQNDNEMIRKAGRGICLKNGGEETKALADAVTEHECEDNGFGHYLFDHLFID